MQINSVSAVDQFGFLKKILFSVTYIVNAIQEETAHNKSDDCKTKQQLILYTKKNEINVKPKKMPRTISDEVHFWCVVLSVYIHRMIIFLLTFHSKTCNNPKGTANHTKPTEYQTTSSKAKAAATIISF